MGPVTVRPSHLQELEERLFYDLGTMLKPLTKMCMGPHTYGSGTHTLMRRIIYRTRVLALFNHKIQENLLDEAYSASIGSI